MRCRGGGGGGWGWGWGGGAKKKRQRGGASEAEGGLWGQEMDGNILSPPPCALSRCFSHRVVDPGSSQVAWLQEKLKDPQKLGFHQKIQFSVWISLPVSTPRTLGGVGGAAQEEVDAVQF